MKAIAILVLVFIMGGIIYGEELSSSFWYSGLGFEFNKNLIARAGYVSQDYGYLIFDTDHYPSYIASNGGWEHQIRRKGAQLRKLYARGGRCIYETPLVFEVAGGLTEAYLSKSDSSENIKSMNIGTFGVGPAFIIQTKEFLLIPALTYEWVVPTEGKDEWQNRGKPLFPKRIAVDLYWFLTPYKHAVLFGDIGYGYFPQGLPFSRPIRKGFGGFVATIGSAVYFEK
ncbi:MAG: hypothetical protein V1681_00850 [Candidatus Neomarinimicrobiota bacterium]